MVQFERSGSISAARKPSCPTHCRGNDDAGCFLLFFLLPLASSFLQSLALTVIIVATFGSEAVVNDPSGKGQALAAFGRDPNRTNRFESQDIHLSCSDPMILATTSSPVRAIAASTTDSDSDKRILARSCVIPSLKFPTYPPRSFSPMPKLVPCLSLA
jgi:hypothetical protein